MPLHTDNTMLLVAALAAASWVLLVSWILLRRLVHDARNGRLDQAMEDLRDHSLAQRPLQARMAIAHGILKHLPERALESMMMAQMPSWVLDACAVQIAIRRRPDRFLAVTRRAPPKRHKWDYIKALFVLVGARHAQSHAMLSQALTSDDDDIRHAAITLLGELGDTQAAGILVAGLAANSRLRTRIASQLDVFPLLMAEQLMPLTTAEDPDVRAWGAQLLGRFSARDAIEAQLDRLSTDADPGVRKAALQSLSEVTSPQAKTRARRLLEDPVPYVRAQAARTLSYIDADSAVDAIAPLLADTDWWVRQTAKESLSRLGMRARPALLDLLDSGDRFARNGAVDVLQDIGAVAELAEQAHGTDARAARARELLERIMQAGERQIVGSATAAHPSWLHDDGVETGAST